MQGVTQITLRRNLIYSILEWIASEKVRIKSVFSIFTTISLTLTCLDFGCYFTSPNLKTTKERGTVKSWVSNNTLKNHIKKKFPYASMSLAAALSHIVHYHQPLLWGDGFRGPHLGSLTASTRAGSLVTFFLFFATQASPPRLSVLENSVQWGSRSIGMFKARPQPP